MNEPFVLTVSHLGEEHELKARFERFGYTHRIAVLIGETTYTFEPDEEGAYRALGVADSGTDVGLLQAVCLRLTKLGA